MHYGIKYNEQLSDEARYRYQSASRPAVTPEAQAQDIARRMIDANNDGDLETARRLALELRPLLLWLPEEAV